MILNDNKGKQCANAGFGINGVQPLQSATRDLICARQENICLQYQGLDERLILKYVFRKTSAVNVDATGPGEPVVAALAVRFQLLWWPSVSLIISETFVKYTRTLENVGYCKLCIFTRVTRNAEIEEYEKVALSFLYRICCCLTLCNVH